MRIKLELLGIIALFGLAAAMVQPTPQSAVSGDAAHGPSALEALAPRDVKPVDAEARALRRAQAIDAERLRLIARGELTAREATPAELRMIRSGELPQVSAASR